MKFREIARVKSLSKISDESFFLDTRSGRVDWIYVQAWKGNLPTANIEVTLFPQQKYECSQECDTSVWDAEEIKCPHSFLDFDVIHADRSVIRELRRLDRLQKYYLKRGEAISSPEYVKMIDAIRRIVERYSCS